MIEIDKSVNVVYEVIPTRYLDVYQTIMYLYTQYGLEVIKDCKTNCNSRTTKIVECYNLFRACVAAYNIGRTKQADLMYNYLKGQLPLYYPNMRKSFNTYTWYIGCSTEYENIIDDTHKLETPSMANQYIINISNGDYIFIVYPKEMTYNKITMSDFIVPFDDPVEITLDDKEYYMIKSKTNYREGSVTIKIE